MEQKRCCDCIRLLLEDPHFHAVGCKCPHHTSQNSGDWEERFDNEFVKGMSWQGEIDTHELLIFFRAEIDRAERRVKEELREKIENKRQFANANYQKIYTDVLNLL